MNYIKVTYPVGSSFIKSTFEDNSSYIRTSVNSTFIKVSYDGGSSGLDAERLRTKVYNVTGATLTKGTVVYINGTHGNLPSVTKAIATGDATSAQTLGLVMEDILDNKSGYIIIAGKLSDLDTQAFANGSQLYLSSTVAGTYTTTKQYAPAHLVYVGIVNRSHPTQGEIEVKIQNGYEADEIHDFAVRNPLNNQGIFFNSTTSLWEKKYVSDALGYTPANASTTLTINGVTFDLSQNRSWTIAAGISGSGVNGQVSYWTGASSLGGSNNLFWDAANNRLGIGIATPSVSLDVRKSVVGELAYFANTAVNSGLTIGTQTNVGYISSISSLSALGFGINGSTTAIRIFTNSNVAINSAADDGVNKLQVTGSAKFTSDILVNGINIGLGAGNVASNLRFGGSALLSNTTGAGNVALGYAAMYYNTGGSNNMAIGVQALVGNSTGDNNVAVGTAALFGNTNGYNNVAIGHWAAYDSVGSLSNSVGANNIFIGYGCLGESGIESNRTWIGNASTTSTWLGGNLLLGTRTNGTGRLQVNGRATILGEINMVGTGPDGDGSNRRIVGGRTNQQASIELFNATSGQVHIYPWNNTGVNISGSLTVSGGITFSGSIALSNNQVVSGAGGAFYKPYDGSTGQTIIAAPTSSEAFSRIRLQTGTTSTDRLVVFGNGNVSIGTVSDLSVRLGVVGETIIRGSLGTFPFIVQSSGGGSLLTVNNNGAVTTFGDFSVSGNYIRAGVFEGTRHETALGWGISFTNANNGGANIFHQTFASQAPNGNVNGLSLSYRFGGATSTFTNNSILINNTINQTSGTGITRGIYINPTLTLAADWRSIQWDNNTGWGIYGAGTCDNYLAGDLSIGTLTTTDWLNIGASTTAKAHIFLTAGVDPTSPANGDIWFDGTNLKMRVGGVTRTFTLV